MLDWCLKGQAVEAMTQAGFTPTHKINIYKVQNYSLEAQETEKDVPIVYRRV